ncbi:MAG: VWA domain-containing protein [Elusimicrobia bacterium]|nr:VWA domain-containing protein [Elusimicrobiota bacterium]
MAKRHGGEQSSGGWKIFIAIVAAWIMISMYRSRSKPVPGAVPALDVPAAPAGSQAKAEWPPSAGAGDKAELAPNLTMRNYYVILDGSGSMADKGCSGDVPKLDAAKKALSDFSKAVPRNAQLGLLSFDGRGVAERVPLGLDNRDRFMEEVQKVAAGANTPLRSAISMGIVKLEDAARRQLGYGEYNLVVVTDGEAVPESEDPRGVVNAVLGRTPIAIHTIGFCIGANHSLNQPGRTLYKTAQNPQELKAGLEDVLAESEKFDVSGFK